MKDDSVIPAGDYCYQLVPLVEGEVLSDDIERFGKDLREYRFNQYDKEVLCPYWQRTDYGMIVCEYLGVQNLDEDDPTARDRAIAHFGSVEAMSQACGSAFLQDEIKICGINVEE
jgi:hypothetical protein